MKLFIYVVAIAVCFSIGYFSYDLFYTFSVSQLRLERLTLISRTESDKSMGSIVFASVIAILPLCFLLIKKASLVTSIAKYALAFSLILGFGIGFWKLRIIGLNEEFRQLSELILVQESLPKVEVHYLKFDIYLLIGFIVGSLITILIYRDKSKPLINN